MTSNKLLDFSYDPDRDPDPGIFNGILPAVAHGHCSLRILRHQLLWPMFAVSELFFSSILFLFRLLQLKY